MTKLEKAVKGLELLKQRLILQADVLGYGYHISDIDNALELLKEREPVKPKEVKLWYTEYACGYCDYKSVGRKDGYKMRFCPCCGRAVKWDD